MYKTFGLLQTTVLSAAFVAAALWMYHARSRTLRDSAPSQAANDSEMGEHMAASESESNQSATLPSNTGTSSTPLAMAAPETADLTVDPNGQHVTLTLVKASSGDDFERRNNEFNSILSTLGRSFFPSPSVTCKLSLGKGIEWSQSNLELLTNSLRLVFREISSPCDLTIQLPTIGGVDSPNVPINSTSVLPLQLRSLSWTGHRDQLELFFGHLPFPFWKRLTHLTLCCNGLTMDDCQSILYKGQRTLQDVKLHTIGRSLPQVLLPFVSRDSSVTKPIVMHHLKSLDIQSVANVQELFANFDYPRLDELTLKVMHTNFDVVGDCLKRLSRNALTPIREWKLDLHCEMDALQMDWVYEKNDDPTVKPARPWRGDFAFCNL